MIRTLRAQLEALACPACGGVGAYCPTCGELWRGTLPADTETLPMGWQGPCSTCGTDLSVVVVSWADWPDPAGCLSDPLPSLEKAWAMPPAQRPTGHRPRPAVAAVAAPPAAPPRPPRPAPPAPHLTPCPPDAQRLRLADWAARGMVPRGLAPATVARGFRQRFGLPPRRDPARRASCAYTERELGASLGALGLAFPANPLAEVWAATLDRVELPSTRMLLSQQARLLRLDDRRAVVGIAHPWGEMAQARLPLLEVALAAAIGSPRAVVLELLEGVAQ